MTNQGTSVLIKFPVTSFRKIGSPYEDSGPKTYVAVVNVKDIPATLEEWRRINVRDAKTKSTVSRSIEATLQDDPNAFFFRNRGLTIIAEKVRFDNQKNIIELEMIDSDINGLLDGGHTYSVIREYIENLSNETLQDFNAYVKVEIIEGVNDRELVTSIVEARNTSTQVKEQSLEELRKSYEQIHTVLDIQPYGQRIAYKEYELNEHGEPKDVDIKEILSYLVCFDLDSYDSTTHPIKAYTSKSAVVDHFKQKKDLMSKYIPLLPKMLQLRDQIYLELPAAYNKNVQGGRFGALKGVVWTQNKPRMVKEHMVFLNKDSEYRIPSGFIYPILASFRNLIKINNGKCEWKTDPILFFEDVKEELALIVGKQALGFTNPNKLGKDEATWKMCYQTVELSTFRKKV